MNIDRPLRRLVIACAIGLGLALAAGGAAADPGWTDLKPQVDPSVLTDTGMRRPEILHEKPSGFWTSNKPAVGGAYRYRLLLLGVGVAAIMGTVIVLVIRRSGRRVAA